VNRANLSRLRQLPGECFFYEAADRAGVDSNGERVTQVQMDRILKRFVAPVSIQLKVGDEFCLFVVRLMFIYFFRLAHKSC
jgi:hypothetical protein